MNIEIINVGTELLLGEIVNTNAVYLQKMCKELGFNVYYQTVVGDNIHRLTDCFEVAFNRGADCVITTAGLGPTKDDLTKELSASYLGLEMIYDENEAKKVDDKCKFVTGLEVIPQNNFKQAYFPKDAYILENEVGTANGCVMSKDEKMIINLPGPPKEMTYVVDHSLKPFLKQYASNTIYTKDIITMSIGESKVDEVLSDIIENQKEVSIALYASEQSVRIRLGVSSSSEQEASKIMQPTYNEIVKRLGSHVIKAKNVYEEVKSIIPPYHIEYNCDLRLPETYDFNNPGNDLIITINNTKHTLGDIVKINLKTDKKETSFEVPLLKDANISMSRLMAKITNQLYLFLQD
ncbi:MAG: molybdopterin-binding protein [Thomasclavelia sp.]|nr:molybdopterin-binding protein [Thomasclavelia sp.]